MSRNPGDLKSNLPKYSIDTLRDAIEKNNLDLAAKCLEFEVNPNAKIIYTKEYFSTPLILAAEKGSDEIVEFLLQQGADPLASDTEGNTALHKAAYKGKVKCLATLLTVSNNRFNYTAQKLVACKNIKGNTPLVYALEGGDKSLALLIQHGAEVTIEHLKQFVSSDYVEAVKTILEKYKIPDLDKLLLLAAQKHRYKIITLLISKGAKVNYQDDNGNSALHFAIEIGIPVAQWKNYLEKPERLPREHIDLEESRKTIEMLLENGANINIQNKKGEIPPHIAANYMLKVIASPNNHGFIKILIPKIECICILSLLISKGADLFAKDNEGETAYARIMSYLETCKLDPLHMQQWLRDFRKLINSKAQAKQSSQAPPAIPLQTTSQMMQQLDYGNLDMEQSNNQAKAKSDLEDFGKDVKDSLGVDAVECNSDKKEDDEQIATLRAQLISWGFK